NIADEIRQTNDPFAVMALIAAINTDPVPRVRLLYVEALGNIVSTDAIGALLSLVLNHADSEVRWSAIDQLNDKDSMQVVPALVAALQGPDNQRINRAAVALKTLGDESAVQPLINVLITQSVVSSSAASGGKTSVTFSPTGGGLALGSNQKQKIISSQNTQVLEALTTLTGVNYGWDQTRWQLWFLNQGVSSTIDIRRDM
ncbi:MAG: HEAT repeat domain-containing protein, partial [Pirellulales bacterium]|nr:HEAT repeat domain-containing protein [Pirellulales bacterium]